MSKNCIHCGFNDRTGFDLLCDQCRNEMLRRVDNMEPTKTSTLEEREADAGVHIPHLEMEMSEVRQTLGDWLDDRKPTNDPLPKLCRDYFTYDLMSGVAEKALNEMEAAIALVAHVLTDNETASLCGPVRKLRAALASLSGGEAGRA